MDIATKFKILLLTFQICLGLWDEISDVIYVATQPTFKPIIFKFLLFFVFASPIL